MSDSFHRLDGDGQTLVFMTPEGTMPRLLYWGESLPKGTDLTALAQACEPAIPHGGLDVAEVVSWLPEPGRGFTDCPGWALRRGERHLYTQLLLQQAVRLEAGWRFELEDTTCGVRLELSVTLCGATGVVGATSTLVNLGPDALAVDALATITLPVPAHLQERQSMGGRWADEFRTTREPVGSAAWLQESRVGRTSHHAFPGLTLMTHGADAFQGEAWSVQIAWSGNHRLLLQRCRLGGSQLQAGGTAAARRAEPASRAEPHHPHRTPGPQQPGLAGTEPALAPLRTASGDALFAGSSPRAVQHLGSHLLQP